MAPSGFEQYYRSYPVTSLKGPADRTTANYGGKIILPQSALHKLTMLHISYPMLFEIRNGDTGRHTHAGVLEFTAEEGRAYLPDWILTTLGLSAGNLVKITNVSLVLGSFVKLQPQSVDFLDISDPKAVLENALRSFSTLSLDDVFQISYNDSVYGVRVLEVKPENNTAGISIVETDLEVDFAPPVGYVEPEATPTKAAGPAAAAAGQGPMAKAINYAELVKPRKSLGARSSGKTVHDPNPDADQDGGVSVAIYTNIAAPSLELPEGQLFFGFPYLDADAPENEIEDSSFRGAGQTLRKSKKRKDLST